MQKFRHTRRSRRNLASVLIGIVVALGLVPAAQAQNDICLPGIGGLAGLPTIDGIVEGFQVSPPPPVTDDPGWNGATRVNLSADLGSTRSAVFQAGRSSTDVYLSFVVDTPAPGVDNTIVLALSTNNIPAHDWRIHIQPFDNSTAGAGFTGSNQVPFVATYWRNSDPMTGWNTPGAVPNTAAPGFWLKDNVRFSKSGSRWALEMRIPWETSSGNAGSNNKIFFPNTGTFRLYVNVLSTSVLSGTYVQDPWPAGTLIVPGTTNFLTQNTPLKAQWGTASLNDRPECTGVSLSWSNIGVKDPANPSVLIHDIRRHTPPGGFRDPSNNPITTVAGCNALPDAHLWPGTKGPLNTFGARPLNGMGANAKVSATFRIANWGIPGAPQWQPIGKVGNGDTLNPKAVTGNPTAEATIAPGALGDLTSNWELTYKQSCLYSMANNAHQCIQVELDSTDPNTRFRNKSTQRNMNFISASQFSQNAEISAIGYGKPPEGRNVHEFLLSIDTNVQTYTRDGGFYYASPKAGIKSEELGRIEATQFPRGLQQAQTWIARGYIKTGRHLIINNTTYEYAEATGAFGYVAGHVGEVGEWQQDLSGDGLKKVADNYYTVQIPQEAVAVVKTTIQTVEPGKRLQPRTCFGRLSPATGFLLMVGLGVLGVMLRWPTRGRD